MNELKQFVLRFFELLNIKPQEIREGIWQVHLSEDLAKELEGWRAKGGLFQFCFDASLAEEYNVELISRGSARLMSILRYIQGKAQVARGTLGHHVFNEAVIRRKLLHRLQTTRPASRMYIVNSTKKYGPYFWLSIRISHIGLERRDLLRRYLVDLVSGEVLNIDIPVELIDDSEPPGEECWTPALSVEEGYQKIVEKVTDELRDSDDTWAQEALSRLAQEKKQLEDFFASESGETSLQEKEMRIDELTERLRPRVLLHASRGAYLFLPKYIFRIIEVSQEEQIHRVIFDPLNSHLAFD